MAPTISDSDSDSFPGRPPRSKMSPLKKRSPPKKKFFSSIDPENEYDRFEMDQYFAEKYPEKYSGIPGLPPRKELSPLKRRSAPQKKFFSDLLDEITEEDLAFAEHMAARFPGEYSDIPGLPPSKPLSPLKKRSVAKGKQFFQTYLDPDDDLDFEFHELMAALYPGKYSDIPGLPPQSYMSPMKKRSFSGKKFFGNDYNPKRSQSADDLALKAELENLLAYGYSSEPKSPKPGHYPYTVPTGWESDEDDIEFREQMASLHPGDRDFIEDPILELMRMEAEIEQTAEQESWEQTPRQAQLEHSAKGKLNFDKKWSNKKKLKESKAKALLEVLSKAEEDKAMKKIAKAFKQAKKEVKQATQSTDEASTSQATNSKLTKMFEAIGELNDSLKDKPEASENVSEKATSESTGKADEEAAEASNVMSVLKSISKTDEITAKDDEPTANSPEQGSSGKESYFDDFDVDSPPKAPKTTFKLPAKKTFFADPTLDSDSGSDLD